MASKFYRKALEQVPAETKAFVRLYADILIRVNYLLEQKGLNQKGLARLLEKNESEISKWLKGEHNLTLKTIAKLQVALNEDIILVIPTPQSEERDWEKVPNSKFYVYTENKETPTNSEFDEEKMDTNPFELEIA